MRYVQNVSSSRQNKFSIQSVLYGCVGGEQDFLHNMCSLQKVIFVDFIRYTICSVSKAFCIQCVLYRMCSLQNVSSIECDLYRMRLLYHVFLIECVLYRMGSLYNVCSLYTSVPAARWTSELSTPPADPERSLRKHILSKEKMYREHKAWQSKGKGRERFSNRRVRTKDTRRMRQTTRPLLILAAPCLFS